MKRLCREMNVKKAVILLLAGVSFALPLVIYSKDSVQRVDIVNCTAEMCKINFAPLPWHTSPITRCASNDM